MFPGEHVSTPKKIKENIDGREVLKTSDERSKKARLMKKNGRPPFLGGVVR